MAKVSVIIPSRNEQFLPLTINKLLQSAAGDIEIIPVLDGYWPVDNGGNFLIPDDKRVKIIHHGRAKGMRAAINAAAAIATGDYLMKTDAHCAFAEGFDEVLKADCDGDWVVIPRRYSLDPDTWQPRREAIDYHYLDCPMTNEEYYQFHGVIWWERGRERRELPQFDIDDTMSWQGSLWFTPIDHFRKHIGFLHEDGYGSFSQEPQELGLKTQLGGGRLVINKKTWYAHLHKGKQFGRGYSQNRDEIKAGHMYSAWYWTTNQWKERVHDIEWLFEKYWPIPKWPDNWRELLYEYRKTHSDAP